MPAAHGRQTIQIAVVGGDATRELPPIEGASIRRFPSSRDGGSGGLRCALAAVRSGSVALVIIYARFMGHSDSHNLREVCRNAGVPYRVVTGGMTTVSRAIVAFVTAAGRVVGPASPV